MSVLPTPYIGKKHISRSYTEESLKDTNSVERNSLVGVWWLLEGNWEITGFVVTVHFLHSRTTRESVGEV